MSKFGDGDRCLKQMILPGSADALCQLYYGHVGDCKTAREVERYKPNTVSKRGRSKPRSKPSDEVALRIIMSAPGVDADDVAVYVREAVMSHAGQYDVDDWRRNIKLVRILKRAWVETVETDAASEEDNES